VVAVALATSEREQGNARASQVRAVLAAPDHELDYARAKLDLDRIVDPSLDCDAALLELDRLASAARTLAGLDADEPGRLNALRKLIYEGGPWNDHRPFAYDHDDPYAIDRKLLPGYLTTRLGNCVTMPILFLILGERLGLDLRLASAPGHLFVRLHAANGAVLNLETTSGAGLTRTEWYQQCFKISDRAIESGLFMRSLSRREAVAEMASTVVEHLVEAGRLHDAALVASVMLEHAPRSCAAMLHLGTASALMLRDEIERRYASPLLIPPALRVRYHMLVQFNQSAFATAEALGWTQDEEYQAEIEAHRMRRGQSDVCR
jgi:regulator of sirC expression with transglutaminase-like and TPR domain